MVGIQAAGGNGGDGFQVPATITAGAGGGSGACAYLILD